MAIALKFIILMCATVACQARQFGEGSKQIRAVTVYNGDVLAVRWGSSEIEVYDSSTFEAKASLNIPGLKDANGIAASEQCNTLYVTDVSFTSSSYVHTVDISGSTARITTLPVDNSETYRVSLAKDGCSGIVALQDANKILKISSNGQTTLTVNLPRTVKPTQAIELSNGQFVAAVFKSDDGDYWRSTICYIDIAEGQGSVDGKLGNCFVPPPEQDEFNAMGLAVDRNGNIYALDVFRQVLKLNSSLKIVEVVIRPDPSGSTDILTDAIFLDDEHSQLYVTFFDSSTQTGSLLVFEQS